MSPLPCKSLGFHKSSFTLTSSLKLGEIVYINGPVITGRDEMHIRAIEKAKNGVLVSEGKLGESLPMLDGSAPFTFSAQVPDGSACTVDILKSYH